MNNILITPIIGADRMKRIVAYSNTATAFHITFK